MKILYHSQTYSFEDWLERIISEHSLQSSSSDQEPRFTSFHETSSGDISAQDLIDDVQMKGGNKQ